MDLLKLIGLPKSKEYKFKALTCEQLGEAMQEDSEYKENNSLTMEWQ